MVDIQKLLRPNIRKLKPYSSARDEYSGQDGIFLDANENSLGTLEQGVLNRYPDPYQRQLKNELQKIYGLDSANLFLGNGSDEALDLLMRAFCEPQKDEILIMPPTYGMYSVAANINDVAIKKVPLSKDFQIQSEKVLNNVSNQTKIIMICSPNNPTANIFDASAIQKILAEFEGIVVLDEAYVDFTDKQNGLNWLGDHNNLVVLRTFSKAWGMANIRLGMAFADQEIITVLNKIKYPYNVNGLTIRKAHEMIQKKSIKEQAVSTIIQERKKMKRALKKIGGVREVFPSEANFLLVRFEKALDLFNFLKDKHIIIRDRTREKHCHDCLRITIGTPQENIRLLEEINNFYNK